VKQLSDSMLLAIILFVALVLRCGIVWGTSERLSQDPDAYRAIAEGLAAGEGYRHPGTAAPTAYRPPAYPLLLAALFALGFERIAVGVVQILMGTATVVLTWLLGMRLGLARLSLLAAGLVAIDPLLIQYTSQVMTETLAAFLLTLMLWQAARCSSGSRDGVIAGHGFVQPLIAGLVIGACTLCRPTVWAFAGLLSLVWFVSALRRRDWGSGLAMVLGALLVVAPWVIRNTLVFGKPILTTTHGGYTLLLGNNPIYYEEVVRGPAGAVWSGDSLRRWQRHLETEMQNNDPPVQTEPERDRWMYSRARRNIVDDPGGFTRACLLRLFRGLWGLTPVGGNTSTTRRVATWGIGGFYAVLFLGMIVGLVSLKTTRSAGWLPLVLLPTAFTIVHAFYWANVRMRAPLMPAVDLLFVRGAWAVWVRFFADTGDGESAPKNGEIQQA